MCGQVDNSGGRRGGPSALKAQFGHARWAELAARADALRALVRIKVADDNDLNTAKAGLVVCAAFFADLAALSKLRGGVDEIELLREISLVTA